MVWWKLSIKIIWLQRETLTGYKINAIDWCRLTNFDQTGVGRQFLNQSQSVEVFTENQGGDHYFFQWYLIFLKAMFWCLVGSNTSWPSASTRQTFNVENDLKVFHLPSPVVLFGHISLCWPSEMRASWANVWLGVRSRGLRNREFYSHIISTQKRNLFWYSLQYITSFI